MTSNQTYTHYHSRLGAFKHLRDALSARRRVFIRPASMTMPVTMTELKAQSRPLQDASHRHMPLPYIR
jgi:hypothetical protein